MNTKKTTSLSDSNEPVSEEFEKFEKNYGGDAVNAHDDRMASILDENAKELDEELTNQSAKTVPNTSER